MADDPGDFDRTEGDLAPGVMDASHGNVRDSVIGYLMGLGAAVILTIGSFYISTTNQLWGPGVPVGLIVLAIAQIGVHLVFFLHITTDPDNTNNIMALAFGILIVVLLVAGTVWIVYEMHQNMMQMNDVSDTMKM
ncbi:MAG TPA: cytochrome o ubiquinol oxidase subunit IV [Roseomonas sp.]|nr:cytochrome o ubiquinol oxidase subunit IV [Roseomonas sp.]